MQGLPRSSLLLHLLLFQLHPAINLPSVHGADTPALVLKRNTPNSPQFFPIPLFYPEVLNTSPLPGAPALAWDAKKPRLPWGPCSSFAAAAVQHPACDAAAAVLSGRCHLTNQTAQSWVSSPGWHQGHSPGARSALCDPFSSCHHPCPGFQGAFTGSSPLVSPLTSTFCSWRPQSTPQGGTQLSARSTPAIQQQAASFPCRDLYLWATGARSLPLASPTGRS